MIKDVSYFLEGEVIQGKRIGILLIHGLTGTPNEMRITAKGLNKAGFSVYAMQLAGHCGVEADLNETTWQDWYASVVKAAQELQEKVDCVFVGGLSMGALLALKLAIREPKLIKGVICYATTFRYDGWSMPFYAKHFFFLLSWFKHLGIYQDYKFAEEPPYGLKDEKIREIVSSSMLDGDSAAAGLANNPYPALAEMLYLSRNVRKNLAKVHAPTLIMHAKEDDIASVKSNAEVIQKYVSGPTKLILLEDSYHLITIDRERKLVIQESIDFINQVMEISA